MWSSVPTLLEAHGYSRGSSGLVPRPGGLRKWNGDNIGGGPSVHVSLTGDGDSLSISVGSVGGICVNPTESGHQSGQFLGLAPVWNADARLGTDGANWLCVGATFRAADALSLFRTRTFGVRAQPPTVTLAPRRSLSKTLFVSGSHDTRVNRKVLTGRLRAGGHPWRNLLVSS